MIGRIYEMDFGNGKKINELMNITKEGNVNIGLQI